MTWRRHAREWRASTSESNRRALRRLVTSGARPGIMGYLGREPVAWCAVAPRAEYVRLENSRVLSPVDDQAVWSVSCFFVRKDMRRRGVSVPLLKAATAFAAKRGARIVEGYPTVSSMARTPDAFVWTGLPSTFERAGFVEVARRSRTRPIMRWVASRRSGR